MDQNRENVDWQESMGSIVYIINSIDYSAKYGLAYQFSNSAVGMIFNDESNILIENRQAFCVDHGKLVKVDETHVSATLAKQIQILTEIESFWKSAGGFLD